MTKVRSRLRLIEPLVPQPPSGTKLNAIDVDGIKATEILVPEARPDRHVLYFHGGGYAFGTEPLMRDFTWRLSAATGSTVLYFDYRLAPVPRCD
jgi:epsilon-lactone hydrolase